MRIRKGDVVQVISGDERGKKGKVLRVFPRKGKAVVEGINFVKRHTRPTRSGQPGGIVEKEAPVQLSNLQPVCPGCGKPTRVGSQIGSGGGRSRTCKRCGEVI